MCKSVTAGSAAGGSGEEPAMVGTAGVPSCAVASTCSPGGTAPASKISAEAFVSSSLAWFSDCLWRAMSVDACTQRQEVWVLRRV